MTTGPLAPKILIDSPAYNFAKAVVGLACRDGYYSDSIAQEILKIPGAPTLNLASIPIIGLVEVACRVRDYGSMLKKGGDLVTALPSDVADAGRIIKGPRDLTERSFAVLKSMQQAQTTTGVCHLTALLGALFFFGGVFLHGHFQLEPSSHLQSYIYGGGALSLVTSGMLLGAQWRQPIDIQKGCSDIVWELSKK
jgi:hypothetical protein